MKRVLATFGVAALLSSCGSAADIGTASPTTLALFDTTEATASITTSAPDTSEIGEVDEDEPTTTSTVPDGTTSTTDAPGQVSTTAAPTTTAAIGPIADPNGTYCAAASDVVALGSLTDIDDPVVVEAYFSALSTASAAVADAATDEIAPDARVVADFRRGFFDILAENEFDVFASFDAVTALDEQLGADDAIIRTDQFTYRNCALEPPLPEQATAAFYISLLGTADDRGALAELLAAAEVFDLDGAICFVEQATADAMHPLAGAPATAEQDAALAQTLSACQLSLS